LQRAVAQAQNAAPNAKELKETPRKKSQPQHRLLPRAQPQPVLLPTVNSPRRNAVPVAKLANSRTLEIKQHLLPVNKTGH
jgi:hypothetical protein